MFNIKLRNLASWKKMETEEAAPEDSNPKQHPFDEAEPSGSQEKTDSESARYLSLYRAVDRGDLEATKKFLDGNPNTLTASLSTDGDTAIHIAVLAGHVKIVEELVKRLPRDGLTIKNKDGATALIFAAMGGIIRIAECLVRKNPDLVSIPNKHEQIPVVLASIYGHKDMVRYLYSVTPLEDLDPERSKNGAMLITTCIVDEVYDIALDLVRHYHQLAYVQDTDKDTALDTLSRKPSAFPSGSQLALWQQWVYSCIHIRRSYIFGDIHGDIERPPHESPTRRRNMITRGFRRLQDIVWKVLNFLVPAITHVYELKLIHVEAQELLSCICKEISTLRESQFERIGVQKAVFKAIKHGIVEFVVEMMKHYPDIIWCCDDQNRGIFLYATLQRQEKIFSLIYKIGAKKSSVAASWDKSYNNMLHQAAFLAPSSQLDRVSGGALQMQRELQWFKEVERIVRPKYKDMLNRNHKTPQVLFSETHKKLVEEGEKWMKETSESCTVVAALIVTIMFAAAFTFPGGYNDRGNPLYLYKTSFVVFLVSDAVSLFASSSSLLMFLGILTSRYREEDFLASLPTKLMLGLSTLFFSMATMMVTFGIMIVDLLRARIAWVSFPIILLSSLPISLFAVLQFPLLVEIFLSTYGPGIFDKPKRFCFSRLSSD